MSTRRKKINFAEIARHFGKDARTITSICYDRDDLESRIPGPTAAELEMEPDLQDKVVNVVFHPPRPAQSDAAAPAPTNPEPPAPTILSTVAGVIKGATTERVVAVFSFTDDMLGQAILDTAEAGVNVKMYLDWKQAKDHPRWPTKFIASDKIQVNFRKTTSQQMHVKHVVADGQQVCVGSANVSANAMEKQSEEVVLHLQGRRTAKFSTDDFAYHWKNGSKCMLKKHLEDVRD